MAIKIEIRQDPRNEKIHEFKMSYYGMADKDANVKLLCNLTKEEKQFLEQFAERFLATAINEVINRVWFNADNSRDKK